MSSSVDTGIVLLAIPPEDVWKVWDRVESFVAKSCDVTEKIDIEDVPCEIANENMQLWVPWSKETGGIYGAVVTELATYPNGYKSARILLLGGREFSLWGSLISDIEEWAKRENCESIEIVGRKGWGRWFSDYAPIEYVFAKELDHG